MTENKIVKIFFYNVQTYYVQFSHNSILDLIS